MNKLADEQNAQEASQDQPASDFYARITPSTVVREWHAMPSDDVDYWLGFANSIMSAEHSPLCDDEIVAALLAMLESAERRAAEADRAAREDCIRILDELMKDATSKGQHDRAAVIGTCAHVYIRHSITKHGNISENRETLASGDMPPGGASE